MRRRADVLLVSQGLAASRAQAQAAIAAGGVRADGRVLTRAADLVPADAALTLAPAHAWASRAGLKLDHALTAFAISPAERTCLDLGASTGGFTDVLRARGAARVYAVDVGHDQLAQRLRADPRIVALERTDARALTRALIPEAVDLIVCDVSFIGLEKALPPALALAGERCDLVALVKPQFQSGPRAKARLAHEEARRLAEETAGLIDGIAGFRRQTLLPSPIPGGEGAPEWLYHARRL